jgi:glycosyl transferase family 87
LGAAAREQGARLGALAGVLVGGGVLYSYLIHGAPSFDSESFWSAWRVGLHSRPWPDPLTYVYPPPLAQVIWPLTLLAWPVFAALWSTLLYLALIAAVGPLVAGWSLVLLPFVLKDVSEGQIHSLLALAIVLGFRYPATWSFVVLTKVTPGIGLLWFAVRREWRNLAMALSATAAIAVVSAILAPSEWLRWFGTIGPALQAPNTQIALSVPGLVLLPLAVRVGLAAVIVFLGARANQRWSVPFAAFLALPAPWKGGAVLLLPTVLLLYEDWRRVRALREAVALGEHGRLAEEDSLAPTP